MFDFLDMVGTYESRKVENTEVNDVVIDTCMVTDSTQSYETGICSKHYNDNQWIIVEQYDDKIQAEEGHKKWVKVFGKELPKTIKDVSTCTISRIAKMFEKEEDSIYTKS